MNIAVIFFSVTSCNLDLWSLQWHMIISANCAVFELLQICDLIEMKHLVENYVRSQAWVTELFLAAKSIAVLKIHCMLERFFFSKTVFVPYDRMIGYTFNLICSPNTTHKHQILLPLTKKLIVLLLKPIQHFCDTQKTALYFATDFYSD